MNIPQRSPPLGERCRRPVIASSFFYRRLFHGGTTNTDQTTHTEVNMAENNAKVGRQEEDYCWPGRAAGPLSLSGQPIHVNLSSSEISR
jgi:hypothetical protein